MASNPTRLQLIIEALDRATGPLRALGARLRDFRRASGIDDLGKAFGGVRDGIGRVVGELGRLLALGGAAAAGIGAIVVKATEAGDALGNAALRAKFAVGAYTELQFAAARAGIEQDKFADGIDKFNKAIGEAKLGKGKLASFLEEVSPRLLQQLKLAQDGEAAFEVMLRVFDRVKDPRIQAALAGKVFGDAKFAQFLSQGSKAVGEIRDEIRGLDSGASQRFVEGAKAMDEQIDSLTETVSFLGRGVMAELFPAFAKLAQMFNQFLMDNKEEIEAWAKVAGEKLLQFVLDLPGHLKALGAKFDELKATLQPLAERVGGFGNLLAILAGLIVGGPLLAAIAALAAAITALGFAMLTTPIGWFMLAVTALGGAAALIAKNWEPIKQFFADLWGDVKGIFQGFLDWVIGFFTLDFDRWWSGFKETFSSIAGVLGKVSKLTPMALGQSLTQATANAITGGDPDTARVPITGEGPVAAAAPVARPTIGADATRESIQRSFVETRQTAAVKIDVSAPRGTKVSLPRGNTAEVSLNVGYTPELAIP